MDEIFCKCTTSGGVEILLGVSTDHVGAARAPSSLLLVPQAQRQPRREALPSALGGHSIHQQREASGHVSPPLRVCPMKGTKGNEQPNRRPGPDENPQEAPVVSYTPEQRRMIREGLRIWARVAIRSYMRKQGAISTKPEASDGGEE